MEHEDIIQVWLESAEKAALPGTRAEKSVKLIAEMHAALMKMVGCEVCPVCSEYGEDVLERCEAIVEEL